MREKHPAYSIAIFYVYASEATVRARCAERAARTGRMPPEELIVQSLEAPEEEEFFMPLTAEPAAPPQSEFDGVPLHLSTTPEVVTEAEEEICGACEE